MTTATSLARIDHTVGEVPQSDEGNFTYEYGKPGTDAPAICEPETRLRGRPQNAPVFRVNQLIEIVKQRWDGTVVGYDGSELTVRLEDVTNPEKPDELVVLSVDEIESGDRPLITPGAMLLWQIGYRYGPKYPRERFSKITFRRLPKWSATELKEAANRSKEFEDFFGANSP